MSIFAVATGRAIVPLFVGRKVRTAQGNAPVKRRVSFIWEQKVPQKITAIEKW